MQLVASRHSVIDHISQNTLAIFACYQQPDMCRFHSCSIFEILLGNILVIRNFVDRILNRLAQSSSVTQEDVAGDVGSGEETHGSLVQDQAQNSTFVMRVQTQCPDEILDFVDFNYPPELLHAIN